MSSFRTAVVACIFGFLLPPTLSLLLSLSRPLLLFFSFWLLLYFPLHRCALISTLTALVPLSTSDAPITNCSVVRIDATIDEYLTYK